MRRACQARERLKRMSNALVINTDPARRVWIESADMDLEGTPYDGADFAFEVQLLSSGQTAKISSGCIVPSAITGRKGNRRPALDLDYIKFQVEQFRAMVTNWRGLATENGPFEYSEENKALLAETQRSLAGYVVGAADEALSVIRSEREDDLGNSEGSGDGD